MGGACVRQRSDAVVITTTAADPELNDAEVQVPPPEELVAIFGEVDISAQPYADEMLRRGRQPKSDTEKVWRSRYTAGLLDDAAAKAAPVIGDDHQALKVLAAMLPLTETIVYDATRWKGEVVPQYQAAVDAIANEPESPEVLQFRGMLLKVKDLFYWECSLPRQDFYMCVLDEMLVKYSGGKRETALVPQESLLMMHSIDMAVHQRKSDMRRDTIVPFFTRVYEEGVAGHHHWNLDDVLPAHGTREEIMALSSETPLLSFALDEQNPLYPGYVLMEGSGRLAGLNTALDVVRARHADFVAPNIAVSLLPFEGSPLVKQNLRFFLSLTWRCTFPDVDIPGWRGQVAPSESARGVVKGSEEEERVRKMARYYGYVPVAPARCVAATSQQGVPSDVVTAASKTSMLS